MKRVDTIFERTSNFAMHEAKTVVYNVKFYKKTSIGLGATLCLFFLSLVFSSFLFVNVNIRPVLADAEAVQSSTTNFLAKDTPKFQVDSSGLVQEKTAKTKDGELDAQKGKIAARVLFDGKESSITAEIKSNPERPDEFTLSVPKNGKIRGGKYTLLAELSDGLVKRQVTQDFTWGVLAINFDQSSYRPNETVSIGMAVLNDLGKTLCDAKATLEITSPDGQVKTLSTEDKSIVVLETCGDGVVTDNPDYEAMYQPKAVGKYKVKLTAETKNGVRTMNDAFDVVESPDFVVKRVTATRIYPVSPYTVKATIEAYKDVDSSVVEEVPSSFVISNISGEGKHIAQTSGYDTISWPVKMKKGEIYDISYTYKAPEISPQFYLLGPIKINGPDGTIFQESRSWQIATDAVYNCVTTTASTTWSNTGHWSGCNSSYPGANNTDTWNVAINGTSTQTVTLTASPPYPINTLSIIGNSVAHTLTFGGYALQTGAITINGQTSSPDNLINVGTGTLTATGLITINGTGTSGRNSSITASTGTINIQAGITFTAATASTAILSTSGAATINLTGTMSTGGTVTMNATSTLHSVGTATVNGARTWGNVTLDGSSSLTIGANQTVSGNWTNSGSFTPSTYTVLFNKSSGTQTLNSGGSSFYSITHSGAGTLQLISDITMTGTFANTAGIFDTKSGSNYAVNVTGNYNHSLGQVTAQASTITVGGSFTAYGGISSTGYNTASVVLTSTGNLTYNNLSSSWSNGFGNLTCGQGYTTTLTTAIGVVNMLTVGSGTLTGAYNIAMAGTGNILSFNASSTLSVANITFYGSAPNIPTLTNGYSTSLYVGGSGATPVQTGAVTLNPGYALMIICDNVASRSCGWDTGNYDLTVGGSINIGNSNNTGTLTGGSSTITMTNPSTYFSSGSSSSVFTSNGTVDFTTPTGGQGFYFPTTQNFYNLTHSGAGTLYAYSTAVATGAFTNSSGTYDSNGYTTTVTGLTTVSGGEYQAKTATQTFNGGLTISGGTFTCAGGAVNVAGNITLSSGALTGASSTITVSGGWDSSGGTFTYGTSIVNLTGTGNLTTPGTNYTKYFFDLTLAASGQTTTMLSHIGTAGTLTLGGGILTDGASSYSVNMYPSNGDVAVTSTSNSSVDVSQFVILDNNLTADSQTILVGPLNIGAQDFIMMSGAYSNTNFKLAGNLSTTGLLKLKMAPFSYLGTTNYTFDTDVSNNYALSVGGFEVGDSWSTNSLTAHFRDSTVDIGSSGLYVSLNSGSHTLNLNSSGVNCAGDWKLENGTGAISQDAGTSIVALNGASAQVITGANTWNNLTINNTYASPDDTYDVDPNSAQTVSGTLTVTDGQWTPYTGDSYGVVSIGTNGIMKPDVGASISVSGTWTDSGTFNHNSGTVTFLANGGSNYNITTGGDAFNNLSFNKTSGVTEINLYLQDSFTVASDLTAQNNTNTNYYILASGTPTVTVSGNLNFPDTPSSSGWTAYGIWTPADSFTTELSGTTSSYTSNDAGALVNGNITLNGSGTQTITDNTNWNFAQTFKIDKSSGIAELGADSTINNILNISAGTLDLNTYNLTLANTSFVNNGTLTGDQGTVIFAHSTVLTGSGTYNFYNVTINPAQSMTSSLGNINVAADWTNNGTFTHNSGTVTLNGVGGSTQVVTGNTTFNNLTATASTARTINFASGSTTTVAGTWTATGASGQNISLGRNGGSGTDQWNINPALWSVDYVTPANSNNQAVSMIDPVNYTDGGNNTNWFVTNLSPDTPTNLGPAGYIDASGWMNDNTPTFNFDISDPDVDDQVKYRIQIDNSFNFSSPIVDYMPSSYGAEGTYNYTVGQVGTYTVGSEGMALSESADVGVYYWRVLAEDDDTATSSYEEAGVDGTLDFRVDTTAPTGGTVKDGNAPTGGDLDWNDGSLTQIKANWDSTEPDSSASGLQKYEYAIRRQSDGYYWSVCSGAGVWQAGANWCDNTTSTSFTQNTLNLQTGVTYYVSLKTTDNAGNISTINSNGIQVTPTLSFSMDLNTITFDNLNNSNNWTNTKTTTLTTSTNASNGYTVQGFMDQLLTSPYSTTIPNFSGTWATPQNWANFCKDDTNDCGFGYTSSDTSVQGSNRFSGGTLFSAFSQSGLGDVLADHTDLINGSTGAVSNEAFTLTHKVSVPTTQEASRYSGILTVIITANY